MSVLLDADTCVNWLRGVPVTIRRVRAAGWAQVALSTITLSELYHGAFRSSRVEENLDRLEAILDQCQVIPLRTEIARMFGHQKASLQRLGTPIADFDLLIASTALTEGRILVTHNTVTSIGSQDSQSKTGRSNNKHERSIRSFGQLDEVVAARGNPSSR